MIRICFVCHGNICRSPMAEFIMKALVKRAGEEKRFYITSKATHTDEIWNGIGSHIYPPAQEMLRKKHIPFDEEKRAVLLRKSDFSSYDYFIGMDNENMRCMQRILATDERLFRLMDFTEAGGSVSDPWYTRDFERAFSDIYRGCEALLKTLCEAE